MPFLSRRHGQPHPHPIRDTLFFVVLLVIFTLAVRVFVMEAYVIPTGSMAPTLVGAHRHAACPACGHGFDIDERGTRPLHCPLCRADVPRPETPLGGDRLLVSKLPVRPHRWDVVVFRNPQERDPLNERADAPGPNSFFIKRVIGLPGEDLYLLDGHVFVRKPGAEEFKIARRADPQENPRWEAVARAAWRPVARTVAHNGTWQFDFDAHGANERPAYDDATLHPYNQPSQGLKHRGEEPVEDVRLAAMTRGQATLACQTSFAGNLVLLRTRDGDLLLTANEQALGRGHVTAASPADAPVHLDLWLLDREALVFANGHCVLRHAFDQPWEKILSAPPPPDHPRILFEGNLTQLELDAAIPYLPAGHGALARAGRGRLVMGNPVTLPDGSGGPQACWFCVGDNSPASTDSRFWTSIHPRVQEDFLGGHAFEGLVPEALMVGRAWGVAWPVDENGATWKPQFSKMRRVR